MVISEVKFFMVLEKKSVEKTYEKWFYDVSQFSNDLHSLWKIFYALRESYRIFVINIDMYQTEIIGS